MGNPNYLRRWCQLCVRPVSWNELKVGDVVYYASLGSNADSLLGPCSVIDIRRKLLRDVNGAGFPPPPCTLYMQISPFVDVRAEV